MTDGVATQHSDLNPIVGGLFSLANTFATPFAKSLAEDKVSTQDATKVANKTVNEQIAFSRLNGSGPADPALAAQSAPTTLQGFISGTGNVAQTEGAKSNTMLWVGVGILGAILLFLVIRKA